MNGPINSHAELIEAAEALLRLQATKDTERAILFRAERRLEAALKAAREANVTPRLGDGSKDDWKRTAIEERRKRIAAEKAVALAEEGLAGRVELEGLRALRDFVARYSSPSRADASTDKEYRSAITWHPLVQAMLAATPHPQPEEK